MESILPVKLQVRVTMTTHFEIPPSTDSQFVTVVTMSVTVMLLRVINPFSSLTLAKAKTQTDA